MHTSLLIDTRILTISSQRIYYGTGSLDISGNTGIAQWY